MTAHPLMEIRFEQELYGEPTGAGTSHWYHVPRVGDLIVLREVQGEVRLVTWFEDHVIVTLIGPSKVLGRVADD